MWKGSGNVCVKCFDAFSCFFELLMLFLLSISLYFFVLTISSENSNSILHVYIKNLPIQYLLSKPFKKCETLSTFSHVHTRKKIMVA